MFISSIRWRLQLWHGIILLLVLTGFGITAHHLAETDQLRRIDNDLQQRVALLAGPMRPPAPGQRRPDGPPREPRFDSNLDGLPPRNDDPSFFRPDRRPGGPRDFRLSPDQAAFFNSDTNSFYYVIWSREKSILARSSNSPANPVQPGERPRSPVSTTRTLRDSREMLHFIGPGDCIVVGKPMGQDRAELRRMALWLAAAGGLVFVLGLSGGWWVATHAIRPIAKISDSARKIADGDFSERITLQETESELGRLAVVLNDSFAHVEKAFARQSRFTADASHELRTPVSVVLSQTQMALARDRSGLEYRAALEACQRAGQRMRQLIESLLDLARSENDSSKPKAVPYQPGRVIAECLELIRPLAQEHGIALASDIGNVSMAGDEEGFRKLVSNLVTNAVQFNHRGGEVCVRLTCDATHTILEVTDNGQGIPEEDLPHIFERFYRVDKSRSRIQGRSGLGLAICRSIVESANGSIDAESKVGTGTTLRVRLPLP